MAAETKWIYYTDWIWLLYFRIFEVIRVTRAEIRKILKLADGLSPNIEDGNMTNEYYNTAIDEAIRQLGIDCNLIPVRRSFPLQANVYQYPLDEDVDLIRRVWYVDSDNRRIPLDYMSPEQWMDWEDLDDTDAEPDRFCYPMFMNEVMPFYVQLPPVSDYAMTSRATEQSIRTLIDSRANFGKTLNNRRIEPGFIVHNLTDGSYGYVDVLNITTIKTAGSATNGTTTNCLEDTTKDFVALDVQEGDIICLPSAAIDTSYAFIDEVTTTKLTYVDMQGAKRRITKLDTYNIGKAMEIRLSLKVPHPGLRNGSYNYFKVTDMYQIEDNSSSVRVIWIGPMMSTSGGSIEILFYKVPELPQDDTDKLQIPDHYKTLLVDCARWQSAFLSGRYDLNSVNNFRMVYKANLPEYAKDVNRPPYGKTLTMMRNRTGGRRSSKYTTASGNRWDMSEYE
jgi:hypothetical protein